MPTRPRLALLCLLPALLAACASDPAPRAPRFNDALVQAETLNIQVVRHATRIAFTNTTARSFGPSRVWINRRFARDIDALAIGQSVDLPLAEFVDEYGDRFRAGGFFAAEAPDRVVQAQLEPVVPTPEVKRELLGLIVVQGEY
jgi:hypothetical protein